jgi:hypothetical protein
LPGGVSRAGLAMLWRVDRSGPVSLRISFRTIFDRKVGQRQLARAAGFVI